MSPAAVGLAVLLHALAALALWWLAQEPKAPAEPALEVYFEPPKPVEPPPEPEQKKPEPKPQPQPEPQPQVMPPLEGLRPPADIVSDKPTQAPPKGDQPKDAQLAPPPPPLQDILPSPDQDLAPPTAADFAKVEPAPTPPAPTPPTPEPAPPLPAPPQKTPTAPPSTTGELPKPPEPAPPAPQQQALATPPAKPQPPQPPQQHPKPPMPQLQKPEIKPSPLSTAPSRRPPAGTQSENPSPSPFVNPADTYSKARAADNYLWQVVRRLQGYRYQANVSATQGITVVRVVIARDGRLLNVTVSRSSGIPEFDQGVLAGVRSGSPYAPLPPDIRGDSATFDLPLVSSRR
jgi:TonB family protein